MAAIASATGPGARSVEDSVELLVKIGAIALEGDALAQIGDLRIVQTLGQVATLDLTIAAWDPHAQQLTWVDDNRFAPGAAIEVALGYAGASALVFSGNFTTFDMEANASARAQLRLSASDILNRLGRGETPKNFKDASYAMIVEKIVRDVHQLKVDAEHDDQLDPKHDVVTDQPMNDLLFVRKLAERIGYDLFADGATVIFRKSHLGESPTLTLSAQEHVTDLHARLVASDQLGGVDVYSFDTLNKRPLVGHAENPGSSDKAFSASNTRAMFVAGTLTKQEQVDARANAELARMRSEYIEGSGTCFGRTDLKPGMVISLDGFGTRFGGDAYVTSVTHTVTTSGFRTAFSWKGQPR